MEQNKKVINEADGKIIAKIKDHKEIGGLMNNIK
jgi:hypothetical protein